MTTYEKLKYSRDFLSFCSINFIKSITKQDEDFCEQIHYDICKLFRLNNAIFFSETTSSPSKNDLIEINKIIKFFKQNTINEFNIYIEDETNEGRQMIKAYDKIFKI